MSDETTGSFGGLLVPEWLPGLLWPGARMLDPAEVAERERAMAEYLAQEAEERRLLAAALWSACGLTIGEAARIADRHEFGARGYTHPCCEHGADEPDNFDDDERE